MAGMTITNTNTLSLLNIINRTADRQSQSLLRLSTGLKINKGSDNPAGLIALRSLENELTGVNAAIASNQRTNSVLGVADAAMTELSSLITEIKSLAQASTNSSGLSAK
ncbi:MAG: flagellin, partial [Planctomycetes bacterium]|nr:flagellin [Planctomycetota bacterium]